MWLEDLQRDEAMRNREFPVTKERIFLGHAGVCPLPRRVKEAIDEYAEGCTTSDQEFVLPQSWLRETRALAADFLEVKMEEVAFVGPTSLGLSFVAEGIKIRRDHNVLIYHDDYPS